MDSVEVKPVSCQGLEVLPQQLRLRAVIALGILVPFAGVLKVVLNGPHVLAHVILAALADGDGRHGEVGWGRGEIVQGHFCNPKGKMVSFLK